MAGGDRFDDKGGAGGGVAGGKDSLAAGGEGVGIDGHRPLPGDADAVVLGDEGQPRPLPNGEDDQVGGQDMFAVGHSFQRQRAVGLKLHEADVYRFHAGEGAVVVANLGEGAAGV